ncbi:folylpolyglutamate synthase/dihydropteroate synthase [Sphingobium sp. B2D3A]|uniref:hypothetical protein n=1 Tax=Sphingobium sp. B2D3A TaxID=2940579 RepID=UPI002224AC37|nr:hypothetical protein [Sphingobium sp. B2D3A]MCW2338798.1 folylpolyglutamate synthase/dihydropteroate synthase [Sphingobium sp. B2D3A]
MPLPEAALRAAPLWAHWPARMQRLEGGPLNAMLPGRTLMLDGGHNPDAGKALADALTESHLADEGIDLIIGMLSNKDVAGFLKPLRPLIRSIRSLPVPGHEHHGPEVFAQVARAWEVPHRSFTTIQEALTDVAGAATHGPDGGYALSGRAGAGRQQPAAGLRRVANRPACWAVARTPPRSLSST